MMLFATIYNNVDNKLYDISELISNLIITTTLRDQPGKCTFNLLNVEGLVFYEGASVSIQIDNAKLFKGFIFIKERTENADIVKITAYDQLRYLKNKDSRVFVNLTSSQIFSRLCSDFVLKYQVVDASNYICPQKSYDAVPLYEMIQRSLDETLINAKQWYIIRDNFGILQHISIYSLGSSVILGDESLSTSFNHSSSIDERTYNQIKLYRDNDTTGKRDIYIVNDTINGGTTLKKWGILQLYEKADAILNVSQIEGRALKMLDLYNSPKQTLKLKGLGDFSFFAGAVFRCYLTGINNFKIDSLLLVTSCIHTINNNEHAMDINTEVIT